MFQERKQSNFFQVIFRMIICKNACYLSVLPLQCWPIFYTNYLLMTHYCIWLEERHPACNNFSITLQWLPVKEIRLFGISQVNSSKLALCGLSSIFFSLPLAFLSQYYYKRCTNNRPIIGISRLLRMYQPIVIYTIVEWSFLLYGDNTCPSKWPFIERETPPVLSDYFYLNKLTQSRFYNNL